MIATTTTTMMTTTTTTPRLFVFALALSAFLANAQPASASSEKVICQRGFDCIRQTCSKCAATPIQGACLENNKRDEDCCAAPGQAKCADGYVLKQGGECFGGFAYTTCCEPVGGCNANNIRDDFSIMSGKTEVQKFKINACREWNFPAESKWQVDDDCCALTDHSACSPGYDLSKGDKCFEFFGCTAFETFCTPSKNSSKVTMSDGDPGGGCEPDFGLFIGIGVGVTVFVILLTVWCCYCAKCCCFKPRPPMVPLGGAVMMAPNGAVQMGTYPPGMMQTATYASPPQAAAGGGSTGYVYAPHHGSHSATGMTQPGNNPYYPAVSGAAQYPTASYTPPQPPPYGAQ